MVLVGQLPRLLFILVGAFIGIESAPQNIDDDLELELPTSNPSDFPDFKPDDDDDDTKWWNATTVKTTPSSDQHVTGLFDIHNVTSKNRNLAMEQDSNALLIKQLTRRLEEMATQQMASQREFLVSQMAWFHNPPACNPGSYLYGLSCRKCPEHSSQPLANQSSCIPDALYIQAEALKFIGRDNPTVKYRYIIATAGKSEPGYRQLTSVQDILEDRYLFEKAYTINGGFLTRGISDAGQCAFKFANGHKLNINGVHALPYDIGAKKSHCYRDVDAGISLGFDRVKNHSDLSDLVYTSTLIDDENINKKHYALFQKIG